MIFSEYLGIDSDYVIVGLAALVLILFIVTIVNIVQMSKLKKKYKKFMSGKDARTLEDVLKERLDEIDDLVASNKANKKNIEDIFATLRFTFQKLGLVKYDAFNEMGGKLSFSLAMLNERNDGYIINAMHSREGCYTYIKEIIDGNSIIALSEEEKEDLFERIEQGDLLAREHYIKGNLRLVLSIIQRFSGSSENADDLFQVGCIGLMKAIDNFDRNLNVKFSTYAVPMIIGEVKRYLRDNHSMRVSRSLRDTAYKAINAREVLTKKLNHEPTIDVIAKEIDMKKEDVLFALDAIATPLSLYEPVYQDGGDTLYLMDQVKDKKNKEDSWVESIALKEAMEHLPDREYDIIKMRFFEGKTQTEVADEIAISQAQVSRLEKNALKHMKNHLV